MTASRVTRRAAFTANVMTGRTQAMSAAYALYDLTSYRRARPVFRGVPASEVRSDVLNVVPVGRAKSFQPCVAVGEQVRRGQVIAVQAEGQIARHASVDAIVERATADGVALRRGRMDGSV